MNSVRMRGQDRAAPVSRPTQADVALAAGVSQASVSLALNGTPETQSRLAEETRMRILEAVEETGYWGNLAARHLAGSLTSVLGVFTYEPVFPHEASDFYYPFLKGIEAEAALHDVDLLLFTSSPSTDAGREGLRSWARRGRLRLADGSILFGRHSVRRDLSELLAHDYPFVFIGRREADGAQVPYVGADYETATMQVVEHLVELGHRRIAIALEFPEHESGVDRRRGFDRAIDEAGATALVLDGSDVKASALLDDLRGLDATAIVTTPDLAAKLRLEVLASGMTIPADLSIGRLGDPENQNGSGVDWTGFTIPRHEMGAASVHMLLRHLHSPTRPGETQIVLPCAFRAGTTTDRRPPAKEFTT